MTESEPTQWIFVWLTLWSIPKMFSSKLCPRQVYIAWCMAQSFFLISAAARTHEHTPIMHKLNIVHAEHRRRLIRKFKLPIQSCCLTNANFGTPSPAPQQKGSKGWVCLTLLHNAWKLLPSSPIVFCQILITGLQNSVEILYSLLCILRY